MLIEVMAFSHTDARQKAAAKAGKRIAQIRCCKVDQNSSGRVRERVASTANSGRIPRRDESWRWGGGY